ncbi:MAG: enoyl-CoA hydratase/isomerase family protein [Proteobacteria bacterium]|nr:enoyl-CoA hydratase/isomerase family protein [Pseudomonadota bacterium]
MTETDTARVRYEVSAGVATITLDRPRALNALDPPTLAALREAASRAALDDAARAVLLTGAGRAFCAGGDVKQMRVWTAAGRAASTAAVLAEASVLHQAIATLYRLPKPLICAVNGLTAGAGVGLALVADVVWAARSATFTLAYTTLGLSPDGGSTFLLPRAVGAALAAELLLTNRTLDAGEAQRCGLVSRVLDDQVLAQEAVALAQRLAQGPTRAYAELRALLHGSGLHGFETQLELERLAIGRSAGTEDFVEGVAALSERREPRFGGH